MGLPGHSVPWFPIVHIEKGPVKCTEEAQGSLPIKRGLSIK